MITLDNLPLDRNATVIALHDHELKSRLAEMGLVEGQSIKVLFKAPFGDPIAVAAGDYVLSLRKAEASIVQVEEQKV